jgi:hypothetical protein
MKASIVTYAVGLLFTFIGLGLAFYTDKNQQTIILAATLPIITLLVADRISHLFKQHEDAQSLQKYIEKTIPQASAIHVFKDSAEAMAYLNQQVKHAVKIENTRIIDVNIEKSNIKNDRLTTEFDANIREGISAGLDYKWLVSYHYQEYGKVLIAEYNADARRNTKIGSLSCCIINSNINPTFNFVIMHYADAKEVLFGWSILGDEDYAERVLLFRDARVVDYFGNVFKQYSRVSKPIKL